MQQTGIFAGRTEVRCPYARWGWTRGGGKVWHPPYRHCHLEVRAAAGGVGLDPTVYAGCENAVGVYGAAGRMQVITVGPVTQGDADAVLEVCRARGLVDAGLYRSEWRDA